MRSIPHLKKSLISKLKAKGIDGAHIPGLIRCLVSALKLNPYMTSTQFNQRIKCMGWHEFELDAGTLREIKAYLSGDILKTLENKPARWFEKMFKAA
jgi:hypothetical protein